MYRIEIGEPDMVSSSPLHRTASSRPPVRAGPRVVPESPVVMRVFWYSKQPVKTKFKSPPLVCVRAHNYCTRTVL